MGCEPSQAPCFLGSRRRSAQPARRARKADGDTRLRGLLHAHLGWLFAHAHNASRDRYARDLIADPIIRFIDRTFLVWALLGLAVPFALGVAIGGTLTAGLTGLLWGGAVRMFVLHHVTYSINSLCHFFGRRRFDDRR